jgi:undecaprenyl-diphosphatase
VRPSAGGWIAAREAQQTWLRFRADWTAIPRQRRARFAWTLTLGWLAGCGVTLGTSLFLRGEHGDRLAAWETALLVRVVDAAPLSYSMAVFLESPGNGITVLTLSLAGAVLLARRRMPLEAIAVLAAVLLAAVIVGTGWAAWPRERPDGIYPGVPAGSLSAFPSGHAALAIPLYGTFAWIWLRRSPYQLERFAGAALVVVIVSVAVTARLVLGAHWLSDIVAGTVIGAGWLAVVIAALRGAGRG